MTRTPLKSALIVAAMLATTAAQAAPVTSPLTTLDCSYADLNGLASDCMGYTGGNDSHAALATLVGAEQWHGLNLGALTQYKDNTAGSGSTTALFDVRQSADDASRGVLTLLQNLDGPFVLTLKGGNNWAAYYIGAGVRAGDTVTFDIPGEQGRGLSHASIYTAITPTAATLTPTAQAVPEPGTAALVTLALAGVAGGAWRNRRRRVA